MADKKVDLDDLFVEELKPRATPISTVVATECCGICNSSCAAQDFGTEPSGADAVAESLHGDAKAESDADVAAEPVRPEEGKSQGD